MKNLIVIILIFLMTQMSFAQNKEGVITYEVKINMHKRLPADRADMKSMIPEFRTHKNILYFNANSSFYTNIEEEEDDLEDNNGGVRMRIQRPQNEYYFDFANQVKIESRDIMGKKYLIKDTLKPMAWKLSDETKSIKGIACKKATYENTERKQKITAWYAESIPSSIGPEGFNSLFGAILQIDINDEELTITASNIEYRALKKNELKVPTSGKPTTEAEFKKIVDEMMKNAPGGMRIIRN